MRDAFFLLAIIVCFLLVGCSESEEINFDNIDTSLLDDFSEGSSAGSASYEDLEPAGEEFKIRSIEKIEIGNVEPGTYDIELELDDLPVEKIEFNKLEVNSSEIKLRISDVPKENVEGAFIDVFAIDPTSLEFESANVTVTAKGTTLYKCKDWNYSSQTCFGDWIFLKPLTPGEEFTFILTPDDPGFAQGSPSAGTPDAGYINDVEGNDEEGGSYVQTQTYNGPQTGTPGSNYYFIAGEGSGSGNALSYITLYYDISSLSIDPSDITNLEFEIDYCHSGESDASQDLCDNDDPHEKIVDGDQNVEVYDWVTTSWVDIGNIPVYSNEAMYHESYNATGTLANYVNSTNWIRVRYEVDFTQDGSGDAFLAIDYAPLTVSYVENTQPTTPTSITCNDGNCNDTFFNDVELNCSGSTDPDGDTITYVINASLLNSTTETDATDVSNSVTGSGGSISHDATTTDQGSGDRSFSHTIGGGNNRLLVVGITFEDSLADKVVNSVTYNGQTLTQADWARAGAGYSQYTALYYLLEEDLPPSGSYTVAVDVSATPTRNVLVGVSSYANVDQADGLVDSCTSNAGQPISCSLTTTEDNSWVMSAVGDGNSGDYTYSAGTERYEIDGAATSSTGSGGDDIDTTAGSFSVSWSHSNNNRQALVAAAFSPATATSSDQDSSWTTYNDLDGNFDHVTNISVTVEVDSFNPEASVQQTTSDPDLELEIYDGVGWTSIGSFDLPSTYTGTALDNTDHNFTLTTTNPSVISAWQSSSNQDLRVRGRLMDYFDASTIDEINYTSIWVDINGRKWKVIGNHTNGSTFSWNISALPDQADVDIKCNAIDLDGSDNYSSYYDPAINLTIGIPVPVVVITNPLESFTYNNESHFIRVNASEVSESCWYEFNGASNITFNCSSEPNITGVEGLNNLTVYANNSEGEIGQDSISFTIDTALPLTVSINSPLNGTFGSAVHPKLKLFGNSRDYSTLNYTVYVYFVNDTLHSVGNEGSLNSSIETEITLTSHLDLIGNLTTYKFVVNATDEGYNNATSNIVFFTLTRPSVKLVSPANHYWDDDGNVSFVFEVYDEAYENISCELYIDDVLKASDTAAPTDGTEIMFNVTNITEGVDLLWKVECTDYENNTGVDSRLLNVDFTDPTVNWIDASPDPLVVGKIINITANVTDNIEVNSVKVNISDTLYDLFLSAGDIYLYSYTTTDIGNISYTVYVYDNINNSDSQTGYFIVEIGGPLATIEWIFNQKEIDKSGKVVDHDDEPRPITFIDTENPDIIRIIT